MKLSRVIKNILFPPKILYITLIIFSAVSLVTVFQKSPQNAILVCLIYAVLLYVLAVSSFKLIALSLRIYKKIRKKIYKTPLGNRYITDAAFRTEVALFFSFVLNILYAVANVVSIFLYDAFWFGVLASYYSILAIMRLLLLRYLRHSEIGDSFLGELKISKICGIILLNLNFVLVGAILMILFNDRGFSYQGIFIYVMAGYTFYMTAHALKDLIGFRKYKSPIMTFSKILSLSAALVSLLALETAVFAQLGNTVNIKRQKLIIALTGICVCSVVIALAFYVIVNYTKIIKAINSKKEKHKSV